MMFERFLTCAASGKSCHFGSVGTRRGNDTAPSAVNREVVVAERSGCVTSWGGPEVQLSNLVAGLKGWSGVDAGGSNDEAGDDR